MKLSTCDRCGDTHMLAGEILCNPCQYEVKKRRVIHSPFLFQDITAEILEDMPTIKQGQFSNLKIENGEFRVYLDRLTYIDYGEELDTIRPPHWPVIFEVKTDKGWRECDSNGRIV